ncbi:uncharacterized protein LOC120345740 [Styela clava]
MSPILVFLHAILGKRIKHFISALQVLLALVNFLSGVLIFTEVDYQRKEDNLYHGAGLFLRFIDIPHDAYILDNPVHGKDIGGILHNLFKEPMNWLFWLIITFPVTEKMARLLTAVLRHDKCSISFIVKLLGQIVVATQSLKIRKGLIKTLKMLLAICREPENFFRKHQKTWRIKKSARKFIRQAIRRHDNIASKRLRLRANEHVKIRTSNIRSLDRSEKNRNDPNNESKNNSIKSRPDDGPPNHNVKSNESAGNNSPAQQQDEENIHPPTKSETYSSPFVSASEYDLLPGNTGSTSAPFEKMVDEVHFNIVDVPTMIDPTLSYKNSTEHSQRLSTVGGIFSPTEEEKAPDEIDMYTINQDDLKGAQVSHKINGKSASIVGESGDFADENQSCKNYLLVNEDEVYAAGDSNTTSQKGNGTPQHLYKPSGRDKGDCVPHPSPIKLTRSSDQKQPGKNLLEKQIQSTNNVHANDPVSEVEISTIPEYVAKSNAIKDEGNADSAPTNHGNSSINALDECNDPTPDDKIYDTASCSVSHTDLKNDSNDHKKNHVVSAKYGKNIIKNNIKKSRKEARDQFCTQICAKTVETNKNVDASVIVEGNDIFSNRKDIYEFNYELSKMSQKEKREFLFKSEVDSYENLIKLEEERKRISEEIVSFEKYRGKTKNPFRWIRKAIRAKFRPGLKKEDNFKLESLLAKIQTKIQIERERNNEFRRFLLLLEDKEEGDIRNVRNSIRGLKSRIAKNLHKVTQIRKRLGNNQSNSDVNIEPFQCASGFLGTDIRKEYLLQIENPVSTSTDGFLPNYSKSLTYKMDNSSCNPSAAGVLLTYFA